MSSQKNTVDTEKIIRRIAKPYLLFIFSMLVVFWTNLEKIETVYLISKPSFGDTYQTATEFLRENQIKYLTYEQVPEVPSQVQNKNLVIIIPNFPFTKSELAEMIKQRPIGKDFFEALYEIKCGFTNVEFPVSNEQMDATLIVNASNKNLLRQCLNSIDFDRKSYRLFGFRIL